MTRGSSRDGRAHLPSQIGQWRGDSRGRWEGDTPVVETTNLTPKGVSGCATWCRPASSRGAWWSASRKLLPPTATARCEPDSMLRHGAGTASRSLW